MYFVFIFKAIGTVVEFTGNVSFTNNHAEGSNGGALYLLTSSQIMLKSGAHLEFVNNTGGYDITNYSYMVVYVLVYVTIIGWVLQ